jgi:predicted transcriptional regulator
MERQGEVGLVASGAGPRPLQAPAPDEGSETRTTILKALLTPKDRFQLAKDLELDWTTIEYHIQVLLKYGLVREKTADGNVRLYELTPTGNTFLNALEEMSRNPK